DELYRRVYQEKVRGVERLRMVRASRLTGLEDVPDGVRATVEFLPTGQRQTLDADVVVLATGYRSRDPWRLLGGMAAVCNVDDAGRLEVRRDYRVVTAAGSTAGIYIPGATEYAHGISSTLLSNIAVRAGELLRSALGHADGTAAAGEVAAGEVAADAPALALALALG
ncbi:SidA/IucD/PvdA family monooxygenase, partial [Frankia sp. CiP1_Cm_nod1]|uniref:SidA/IucD/PvdA family monooxygenase n=1 Tax=Frankia sp. CiP1_Cm_nod1 TaxID=2897160 RepID=UPI002024D1C1